MKRETGPDADGYLEAEVIWGGALDEIRAFAFDGESLDPDDRRTFTAWLDDVKRDALDADADVDIYVVEHGHPIDVPDGEECACATYVPDCWPYWSHHRVDSRDE